jgi:ribosomal protein S18 acetylase RimI-like enzyme
MTSGPVVEHRLAGEDDRAFVDGLLLSDALAELAALPEPVRSDVAAMQVRARRTWYAESWPDAVEWLVLLDGSAVGRLLLDTSAERVHVVDIRLDPPTRGRGVGTEVLLAVCADADGLGVPVSLSVRAGAPAEAWYRRLGFVDAASREVDEVDRQLVRPAPDPER